MIISKPLRILTIGMATGLVLAAYAGINHVAKAADHKMSLEQRVRVLEDKEEIRQLLARYMHYLDHRDMVRYSELFTEDGIVLADQGKWEGRAAMQNMFQPKPATGDQPARNPPAMMVHNVTDIVIHVNGDTARTWGKYYAFFPSKGPGERPTISGIGGYNDWLVRVNGEWKFKKREILKVDPEIEF
jgi:ketosteroid isomerase-like protein